MKNFIYIFIFCLTLISFKPVLDLDNYVFVGTIALSDADLKAFPGAIGHGEDADGARGTNNIYFVTNTNNSGAGSFDQAILDATASGGYIVPRLGGTVVLTNGNDQYIQSNIYIVGQAAPGGGLCIYGTRTWMRGSNTVVRHIKFRPGDDAASTGDDAMTIGSVDLNYAMTDNVIDHCSFTWGDDENVALTTHASNEVSDASASINRFSFTNNIVAHEFANKYNFILYGEKIFNISLIGNLFSGTYRNIRNSTTDTTYEMINNAIYNYEDGLVGTMGTTLDLIGNIYHDGADVQGLQTVRLAICSTSNCWPSGLTDNSGSLVFYEDNTWNGSIATYDGDMSDASQESRQVASSYTPLSNAATYAFVEGAGARNGLTDGLDTVDAAIMDDWINDTGSATQPSNEAGTTTLPTLAAGTPYVDTDSDGLSDAYELDQGGTTTSIAGFTRPATAVIASGDTVDQSAMTSYASNGFTHLDIFFADLAGDWDAFDVVTSTSQIIRAHNIRLGTGKGGAYLGTNKIN